MSDKKDNTTIAELPDRVPDGCMCILVSATYLWPFGNSELIKNSRYVAENFKASRPTHFYILPLPPAPERKLHPCHMPGCRGLAVAVTGENGTWRVKCIRCGMLGPIFNTKEKAELEWGHAE